MWGETYVKSEGMIVEGGVPHVGDGLDVDLEYEYEEEKWVDNIEEIG